MVGNKNTGVDFNKNDKQLFFNQVKGIIYEIDIANEWCSVTLSVGHENSRLLNFSIKKKDFSPIQHNFLVNDKVNIKFFLTSRFKNGRWHTTANIIAIDKLN